MTARGIIHAQTLINYGMETDEIQKTPEETPQTTGNEPQAPQQTARIRGADGKFVSANPAKKPAKPAKKTTTPQRGKHPENIDLKKYVDKNASRKIKKILNPPEEEEEPEELPELPEDELPEELQDEEEEEEQEDNKSQIFKTYGIIIGLIVCGIAAGWVFLRRRSKKLAAGNIQPYYAEAQS